MEDKKPKDFKEAMFAAIDNEGMVCHTSLAFSAEMAKTFISSLKKARWDELVKQGYKVIPVSTEIIPINT